MRLQRQSIKDSKVRGNGTSTSLVKTLNSLNKPKKLYVKWVGTKNVMDVHSTKMVKAQDSGFTTLTLNHLKLIGKLLRKI